MYDDSLLRCRQQPVIVKWLSYAGIGVHPYDN